jgi:hypothetical protein
MEVVIGVILLVGAFALWHNTADQDATRGAGEQSVTAAQESFLSTDCRYRLSGPVQRDLTLPYSRQRLAERTGSGSTRVAYRGD